MIISKLLFTKNIIKFNESLKSIDWKKDFQNLYLLEIMRIYLLDHHTI